MGSVCKKQSNASTNNQKLKKSTICNAINQGDFGVSLLKNEKCSSVPPKLTHGLACHAIMMQASGDVSHL